MYRLRLRNFTTAAERFPDTQRLNVFTPLHERGIFRVSVVGLVVDAGDARHDMAQQRLDHMRLSTERLMQAGGEHAPKIVQRPITHLDSRIELGLRLRPAAPAAPAAAEYKIALGIPCLRFQNGERRRHRKISCGRLFLVRAGGNVITAPSRSISDQLESRFHHALRR